MTDMHTVTQDDRPLFTCLSCSIAFLTAEEQRTALLFPPLSDRADCLQGITIARITTDII